jgi:hypothetical protein
MVHYHVELKIEWPIRMQRRFRLLSPKFLTLDKSHKVLVTSHPSPLKARAE